MPDSSPADQPIAENRKARHEYHIFDTYEAGIVLLGTEVKSIREGRVNLKDSYGRIEKGEVFLHNLHVSPYSHRGYAEHEPLRRRKLLLTRQEIHKLTGENIGAWVYARACAYVLQAWTCKSATGYCKRQKVA